MADPGATRPTEDAHASERDLAGLSSAFSQSSIGHLRIGKYQLKREVAVGGMGTVFEAVQDQPRRSVAIKLMRSGLQSPGAQRRFEYESQLLARLRHPGIAQVFDAGTHQQGSQAVPYYVMEYIPGALSITSYADAHKLTVRRRLELFATVCDAVQYAHQRGIIHRDIKPGNILVDGEGRAKVIDFGVARALDSDLASPTFQTDVNRVVGTLQYMSPEQCDSDPLDLDARTDVYALGVVLYELLCGRLPYDVSRVSLFDAARIIREQSPTPPRQVIKDLSDDLETVLLKAMHKERKLRYQSASELAADVRHVLNNEPITARRETLLESVVRRVRRQATLRPRVLAAIATILALLLAIGIGWILDRYPGLHRWFETTMTARLAVPAQLNQLKHVAIVAIRLSTDFAALAEEAKVDGFDASDPRSARAVHAELITRLTRAHAKPRAIAWDIMFEGESPCDTALAHAVDQAHAHGMDVIAAARTWKLNAGALPEGLSQTIARSLKGGGVMAGMERDEPWFVKMGVRQGISNPSGSFALLAATAFHHPGAIPTFQLDQGEVRVYTHYAPPRAGSAWPAVSPDASSEWVDSTWTERAERDAPEFALRAGDITADFIVALPDQSVFDAVTHDYEAVFRASPQELRQWFADKVVVIGDARPGRDGPQLHPSGRRAHGFALQAAAIDAMIRNVTIKRPGWVDILGVHLAGQHLFDAAGAVLGAILGWFVISRGWRYASVVTAIALTVGLSVVAYYRFLRLLDPFVAMIAIIAAAGAVAWIVNVHHERRRQFN